MALTKSVAEIVDEDRTGLLAKHPSWERVRLGEIAAVLNGFPFDSAKFSKESGTPLVRIRDVTVGATDTFFAGDYDSAHRVSSGDLLIGMDGDFNSARWRSGPALLNQRVCKVTPNVALYEPRLLDRVLPPYLAAIHAETSSVTVKHLSSKTVEDIWLPLPPIAEQRRLAEKLDELQGDSDAGVEELRRAQKKLALYRQSLLRAAVEGALRKAWRVAGVGQLESASQLPAGWSWVPIQQCSKVISGFAFSSRSFASEGTSVVKIANVGHGRYLDEADSDHLDAAFEGSHSDFLVQPGDVLIALTRPITNDTLKSCRYPVGRPRALLNQRVAALRPLNPALAPYLFHVTRSTYFRRCMAAAATQTLQPNVSPLALRQILVPMPAAEEAIAISNFLDQEFARIESVEAEIERVFVRSAAQRQNILRAAFAGHLVPQDPADEPASALLERIRAERATQPTLSKPPRSKAEKGAA